MLLLVAWVMAQYPPIRRAASVEEFENLNVAYGLILSAAVPWFLQWAGVVCALFGIVGSRLRRGSRRFAMGVSLTLALIWWAGVVLWFRGLDPLQAIVEVETMNFQWQFGGPSFTEFALFGFVGPILGPLQLHGPLALRGMQFLYVGLSTTLVVGYLLFVGHWCQVGNRHSTAGQYLKFTAAMLLLFLPAFILLFMRLAKLAHVLWTE